MFSRLSSMLGGGAGALPYEPIDPTAAPKKVGDVSMWSHTHGKSKVDGKPVSMFMMDASSSSADQIAAAQNAVRRMKTLRHPSFLLYIDSVVNEKQVMVVTERVTPLAEHLAEDRNVLAISWGLHQIAKAIGFLVDSQMTHCNICLSSIFVDGSGEWKIGGLELLRRATDGPDEVVRLPTPHKYQPPEKKGALKSGHPWSEDMWGFGCLIWEVFNGELPRPEKLTDVDQIPKKLLEPFVKLIGANPKSRPSPASFIAEARNNGRYLDNDYVNATFFLEEINLKSPDEVAAFYKGLPALLDGFPRDACVKKILPQLLQAFNYGGAGSAVLGPLFKIGSYLGPDDYREKIVPCVVKLFSSTDRATRISLLRSLHLFIDHLAEGLVSEQIFPQLSTGFTDSVPAMREETVKAMLLVVPKLTDAIVDNQLLRFFAKLQMDETPSIRVNTTICLGKIAPYLSPASRERVLAAAFARCLKDNFSHARAAGLMAIKATAHYHSTAEIVHKIFPSVVVLTIDPDDAVRTQALALARWLLERIEKGPAEADTTIAATSAAGNKSGVGSSWAWASSAVTSVSSVFSKTATSKSGGGGGGSTSGSGESKGQQQGAGRGGGGSGRPSTGATTEEEDEDEDFVDAESGPASEQKRAAASKRLAVQTGGDDDASDYGGGSDDGGWGKDDDDDGGGGWGKDDGWGNDDDDATPSTKSAHKTATSTRRDTGGSSGDGGWGKSSPARSSPKASPKASPRDTSHDSESSSSASKPRAGGIKLGKKKVGGGLGGVKKSGGLGGVKGD